MAAKKLKLDVESISCPICLDLLKDPVTIPCGHSYCMNCINTNWDREYQSGVYKCPQCRKVFKPRPILEKNVMLANLVEELKETGLEADRCYAGPEDVACDVCTGRKLKAVKTCLTCVASYCEDDLQPHYEALPLKKHKLVEPSKKLQEHMLSEADGEVKKLMDEHKEVLAAVERAEREEQIQESRKRIQQRIQDQEKNVKLLPQEVEAINASADKALEDSEKIFTKLIRLLRKRSSDVKLQIRSQQETEVNRVRELQEKLEQEITELKRKDAELEQLSATEDHSQFLLSYPSLSALSESKHSSRIKTGPLIHFEDVTAAVSELRDKLQDVLAEDCRNISILVSDVDALVSRPEPETREDFLMYAREMTFNPNSANIDVGVIEFNRQAMHMPGGRLFSQHPERFTYFTQVLSKECLLGRSYCEVRMRSVGLVLGVAYKSIRRAGKFREISFGLGENSWSLYCFRKEYMAYHGGGNTVVAEPSSDRIGIYVDHRAGVLAFYCISVLSMTLLHRFQMTFSEPLYVGVNFLSDWGDYVEFIKLK